MTQVIQAYRIVEWKRRYEVTSKGHPAEADTPMNQLRKSPLEYIRSSIYGHSIGPALATLIDLGWVCGEINQWAIFGIFHKLLEIAGNQRREYRGWILDKDQQPMGPVQFVKLFRGHEIQRVKTAFEILCHPEIRWLEVAEFLIPADSGKARNIQAVPESQGSFLNENEAKVNKTETIGSGISPVVSDSEISEARDQAVRKICGLLPITTNPSDTTTFRDIFDQVEQRVKDGISNIEIFDAMITEAKAAARFRSGKIGRFVNAMKDPRFGYIPEHRRVLHPDRIRKKV